MLIMPKIQDVFPKIRHTLTVSKVYVSKINIAGGAELPKNLETKLCPNESQMPYHIVLQDFLFVQLDFLLALSKFSSLSLSLSFEWANRLLLK